MKIHLFLCLLALMASVGCSRIEAPVNLRCEYRDNPIGLDVQSPRFTWMAGDTLRGTAQTAYQLLVATSPEKLTEGEADVWNSGVVTSDRSVLVPFEGEKLRSSTRYYWTVRTWNQEGKGSAFSLPAYWETGKLNRSDWKAQWICKPDTGIPLRSVAFRKAFKVTKEIKQARLYATGLGNYVMQLNGQKVGDQFLSPGWTDYNYHVQYQTYDVTGQLKTGENLLTGMLGNMWWSSGLGWAGAVTYSHGPLRLLAQLEVDYADGSQEMIATDPTWQVAFSPIVENTIYHGETYDARIDLSDASLWQPASVIDGFNIELVAQNDEPIRLEQELTPVAVHKMEGGDYVFDMGQNMVGLTRLKVKGKPGQTITLRYAELLHPDGTVAQENLRSAKATDRYICKGEGTEEYIPSFTYHGFRYVQVSGLTEEPAPEDLTGLVLCSDLRFEGTFECSEPMINKFWQNTLWGQKGNMVSIPTDCPQRDERLGWMGDAQVFAPTASFNAQTAPFYTKWMQDIRDSQAPEGWVTDVCPYVVVGGPAKPAWGDAVVIVPWEVYRYTGDTRILETNYPAMKAWVDYMTSQSKDYLYVWESNGWYGYGDWVAVEASPAQPLAQIYYHESMSILSKAARLLGKEEDAARYEALLPRLAEAFHKAYYETDKKNYLGGTQCANVLPYWFGLVPEEIKSQVVQNIVDNVIAKDYHPTTGFYATAYLLPILSETGHHDIAWKLADQRTYPSWGYMVEQGATTIWELWNSDKERPEGMNSRNHFAYGSVVAWYYGYLAGIRLLDEYPGYKKFQIAPMPVGELTYAKASVPSEYGTISSSWTKRDGVFRLEVVIPGNTSALVSVPLAGGQSVMEGTDVLVRDGGMMGGNRFIHPLEIKEGRAVFEVAAGKYVFEVK